MYDIVLHFFLNLDLEDDKEIASIESIYTLSLKYF